MQEFNSVEFSDPRVVALYDTLNPFGPDSEFFCAQAKRLGAASIIDLGCGTGLLTCELAKRGHNIVGIDPSGAMLAVAKGKACGVQVEWVEGSYQQMEGYKADMVLMTSHVAQFFLRDEEWHAVLRASRAALNAGGHIVFDVRRLTNPPFDGWPGKTNPKKFNTATGPVEWWFELLGVSEGLVRYELHYFFEQTGEEVVSVDKLMFRTQEQVTRDLCDAGFAVEEVFGDWDGSAATPTSPEMVFVANKR